MAQGKCPVVGLAGGIGSGKSTIAGIFKGFGAVIVDADELAHRVLEDPAIRSPVSAEFGPEVIDSSGVSRAALAAIVFDEKTRLDRLNAIIHPPVIAESKRLMEKERLAGDCGMVIFDAPLVFEAGLDGLCDFIVYVEAAGDTRGKRLAASRGWANEELLRREKFQDSLISKRRRADYIIDNNGSLEDAREQVTAIWGKIIGS